LFFSHIRAASSGRNPHESVSISSENCHPFKFGSYVSSKHLFIFSSFHLNHIPPSHNFHYVSRHLCTTASSLSSPKSNLVY
jgi:hypothetical protein